MPKYHDLAIRWNDENSAISQIVKTGYISVHGLPHYFEKGRQVAIVTKGNIIQLLFTASAIEGPKKVKLANGKVKQNGYCIKANKKTFRQPKQLTTSPVKGWFAIGQFRYFNASKMKAILVEPFNPSKKREYIEKVSDTEFVLHTKGIPGKSLDNPEARLVDQYIQWTDKNTRYGHNYISDANLFVDLFDLTHWQLIEAKISIQREAIRMAIGQLRDYKRYYLRTPSLAVLLASKPCPECIRLLTDNRISVIWKKHNGTFVVNRWQDVE